MERVREGKGRKKEEGMEIGGVLRHWVLFWGDRRPWAGPGLPVHPQTNKHLQSVAYSIVLYEAIASLQSRQAVYVIVSDNQHGI